MLINSWSSALVQVYLNLCRSPPTVIECTIYTIQCYKLCNSLENKEFIHSFIQKTLGYFLMRSVNFIILIFHKLELFLFFNWSRILLYGLLFNCFLSCNVKYLQDAVQLDVTISISPLSLRIFMQILHHFKLQNEFLITEIKNIWNLQ